MKGIKIEISGKYRNNSDFHEFLRETINPRFEKNGRKSSCFYGTEL